MKTLLLSCIGLSALFFFSGCSSLSSEQEKLFFETSDFAEPILIPIPGEGSKKRYDRIKANPNVVDNSFIPKVSLTIKDRAKDFNPRLMAFLKKEGYITMEQLSQTTTNRFGTRTEQHEFIFYTDKMKSQMVEKEDAFTGSKKRYVLGGKRILKSVDYTNKREEHGSEVLSIAFSYTITSAIKEVSDPNSVFKGEAKAYLNPDNGKWELANMDLKDRGQWEIIDMMNP